MDRDFLDQVALYLPKYLSPAQTSDLYDALRQFPHLPEFYVRPDAVDEDLLQGDGWRGFVVSQFGSGVSKSVAGIIVSNSCDIDTANAAHLPRRVLFCPLVSLQQYEKALLDAGLGADQVSDILKSIREQKVTSIFYLPAGQFGPEESLALLDDVHPHPLSHFKATDRSIVFRLHQSAFFLFAVKLSIHFCRLQEGVSRFSAEAA